MIFPVIEILASAEGYVCQWRNGELHIEPSQDDQ